MSDNKSVEVLEKIITKRGWSLRPGQAAMVEAVDEQINRVREGSESPLSTLTVSAPVGTGKTMGYLVPALFNGKRTVVSTGTKSLQDQIVGKDLPQLTSDLSEIINYTPTYGVIKGKANYLDVRAARNWLAKKENASSEHRPAVEKVIADTVEAVSRFDFMALSSLQSLEDLPLDIKKDVIVSSHVAMDNATDAIASFVSIRKKMHGMSHKVSGEIIDAVSEALRTLISGEDTVIPDILDIESNDYDSAGKRYVQYFYSLAGMGMSGKTFGEKILADEWAGFRQLLQENVYTLAYLDALQSDVAVTNTALVGREVSFTPAVSQLDKMDVLIVDEAHGIEEELTRAMSAEFSFRELEKMAKDDEAMIRSFLKSKGRSDLADSVSLTPIIKDLAQFIYRSITGNFYRPGYENSPLLIDREDRRVWLMALLATTVRRLAGFYQNDKHSAEERMSDPDLGCNPSMSAGFKVPTPMSLLHIENFMEKLEAGRDYHGNHIYQMAYSISQEASMDMYNLDNVEENSMTARLSATIINLGMVRNAINSAASKNDEDNEEKILNSIGKEMNLDAEAMASIVSEQSTEPRNVTLILASGTISAETPEAIGSDDYMTNFLEVPSPFDHNRSRFFMPTGGATPAYGNRNEMEKWFKESWERASKAIQSTDGGVMFLCSSHNNIDRFYEMAKLDLKKSFPDRTLLRQERGNAPGSMTKNELIEFFKKQDKPILFATLGFWEGVDIPGNDLQLVIMDKIPYPSMSDPIMSARQEAALRRYSNRQVAYNKSFGRRARTLIAQGAGRLIRSEGDVGGVMLLDTRAVKKSDVLTLLPSDMITTGNIDEFVGWMESLRGADSSTPTDSLQEPTNTWWKLGTRIGGNSGGQNKKIINRLRNR